MEPVDVLVDVENLDVENLVCMLCEEEIDDMAISMNCLGNHTLHISCVEVFGDSNNCPICFGRVVVLNNGKVDYKPTAPEDIISAYQTLTEHFKKTLSLKSCHSVLMDASGRMVKFFLGKKILLVNVLHPVVKSLKNASEKSYLFRLLPDFLFEACCFDDNLTPIDPKASSVTICKFVEAAVAESVDLGEDFTRLLDHFSDPIEDYFGDTLKHLYIADVPPEVLCLLDLEKKELILNRKSSVIRGLKGKDDYPGVAEKIPVLAVFSALLAENKVPPNLANLANVMFEFAEIAVGESVFLNRASG